MTWLSFVDKCKSKGASYGFGDVIFERRDGYERTLFIFKPSGHFVVQSEIGSILISDNMSIDKMSSAVDSIF